MKTTIQVSEEIKEVLKSMKLSQRESYEDVIWDLIEASMELSPEALKSIEEAYKDIKEGRVYSSEEVKKRLRL